MSEAGRTVVDARPVACEPGDNPNGVTTESWFHAGGCRRWLTVRRNTTVDAVLVD
jgi:hypothetical protein